MGKKKEWPFSAFFSANAEVGKSNLFKGRLKIWLQFQKKKKKNLTLL